VTHLSQRGEQQEDDSSVTPVIPPSDSAPTSTTTTTEDEEFLTLEFVLSQFKSQHKVLLPMEFQTISSAYLHASSQINATPEMEHQGDKLLKLYKEAR